MKSLLCISYLWLKEVYFVNLLLALIECTCAVLENVHVLQAVTIDNAASTEGS